MTTARNARLAIWGVVLIWGSNFAIVKATLIDFEPLSYNALRFVIASAILFALVRSSGGIPRVERADIARLVLLGLIGNTLYQLLFILGIDRTLAGNASLILATVPAFTAVMSVFAGHERVDLRTWFGVALSFVGIGFVVAGGARAIGFGGATVTGDLLILAAAVAWSAYTVIGAPLVRKYGALPVTAIVIWIGTTGLVLAGVPGALAHDWAAIRPLAWIGLAYSGVFGIAVAYILWYYSVRAVGSTRTAVYSNTIPLVAVAFAWATIGEVPTWLQVVGAAAILSGVTMTRRPA